MAQETHETCLESIKEAYRTATDVYARSVIGDDDPKTQTALDNWRVAAQKVYYDALETSIRNTAPETDAIKADLDAKTQKVKKDLELLTAFSTTISKVAKMVAAAATLATFLV